MAKLVTKTYGEALMELAIEEQKMDALAEEAKAVLDAIAANPEMMGFFQHPKIGKEEKLSFVEQVFTPFISDTMVGFLRLIVQKDRYVDMDGILEYFLDAVKAYKKIGVAEVTSAVALSQEQQNQLVQKLLETTPYVQFETSFHIDPALIGGMVIRVGDQVVDSSVRTRLQTMAKILLNIQLSE